MTENAMNKTSDTTAADLPQAPNGHGAANGTKTDETPRADTATEDSIKDAPSSKKNKRKQRRDRQHASAQDVSTAGPTTTGRTEPTPDDPQPSLIEELAAPIEQPPEDPAEPILEQPAANLRLRIKVWTDPTTTKRYLMPSAFMRDVLNGQPISDVMYAYAMRDDDTKLVTMTAVEWNALPFFYFMEDGPVPRATARPVDVVVAGA